MDLSVIIVNYNTAFHLRNCLKSIQQYSGDTILEVIVVDNKSVDREIEKFPQEFPEVKFFFRNVNDGFGSGCNFGVSKSSGKYLLFLNPDIILTDGTLEKLITFLDQNKTCGIVSGVMVDENKSVIYSYNNFPSYMWELYHMIGIGYDRKIKRLNRKAERMISGTFETDWFHGAFFMMRKNDFIRIGGFNENYFIYYEDVEICYKVKKKLNKKVVCIPDVKVFHHTLSSLKDEKNDNIYIFHLQRSKIIFFNNYNILKKSILHLIGMLYVTIRIICLPVWSKYKGVKKEKLNQLLKILKLYFNNSYLYKSRYEYIK